MGWRCCSVCCGGLRCCWGLVRLRVFVLHCDYVLSCRHFSQSTRRGAGRTSVPDRNCVPPRDGARNWGAGPYLTTLVTEWPHDRSRVHLRVRRAVPPFPLCTNDPRPMNGPLVATTSCQNRSTVIPAPLVGVVVQSVVGVCGVAGVWLDSGNLQFLQRIFLGVFVNTLPGHITPHFGQRWSNKPI